MASVVIGVVGTALVNALAFSGSNFLFSHLDKVNYDKERKRHDLAIEKLNEETEEWNKERKNTLDFINKEFQKRNIAEKDFRNVDEAMELHSAVTRQEIKLRPKPELKDFYVPSDTQRKYEYTWLLVGTMAVGLIVYKYV